MSKKHKIYTADSNFLRSNTISEWMDLPLWLDNDYFTFDNRKMKKDLNIKISDFETSIKETLAYVDNNGWSIPNYGIPEDVRKKLIEKLKLTTSNTK